MMGRKGLLVVLGVVALIAVGVAAAAVSASDGDVLPPPDEGGPRYALDREAQAQLAAELGVEQSDITVVSVEEVVWTDSCLGLGGPAESCLREDTPGWLVILDAQGDLYEAHTNADGSQIRFAQ